MKKTKMFLFLVFFGYTTWAQEPCDLRKIENGLYDSIEDYIKHNPTCFENSFIFMTASKKNKNKVELKVQKIISKIEHSVENDPNPTFKTGPLARTGMTFALESGDIYEMNTFQFVMRDHLKHHSLRVIVYGDAPAPKHIIQYKIPEGYTPFTVRIYPAPTRGAIVQTVLKKIQLKKA